VHSAEEEEVADSRHYIGFYRVRLAWLEEEKFFFE
jgi:hypothetical protein